MYYLVFKFFFRLRGNPNKPIFSTAMANNFTYFRLYVCASSSMMSDKGIDIRLITAPHVTLLKYNALKIKYFTAMKF